MNRKRVILSRLSKRLGSLLMNFLKMQTKKREGDTLSFLLVEQGVSKPNTAQSPLGLPKKICVAKIFWEKETQALEQSGCPTGNRLQSSPRGDVVDLRRIELRSYKVQTWTLHA